MINIILHCSDSSFGNAVLIDSWHEKRGFKSPSGIHIGYNAVILNGWIDSKHYNPMFDGYIETGRPFDDDRHIDIFERGAHTIGMNSKSFGFCLIGHSGKFTDKQINSLWKLLRFMATIDEEMTIGQHSDYSKSKPNCAGLTDKQMKEFKYYFEKSK